MKSISAVALLVAVFSLCNLSDKMKPDPGSSPSPETSNSNSAANDRVAVLVELMKIEDVVTNASFNGDISTLAQYIADDYSGTGADGVTQNKNQVLAATKRDTNTRSWKISDGELVSLDDDRAVLTYIQSQTLKNGRTYRARVTDTFVKRNGRWLVQAEQQTLMK
jgi:hypothetical protein